MTLLHFTKRQLIVLAALVLVTGAMATVTYAIDVTGDKTAQRGFNAAAAAEEKERAEQGRDLPAIKHDVETPPAATQPAPVAPQAAETVTNTPAQPKAVTRPVERPAVVAPQPGIVSGVVDTVKETVNETLNCQYPLRPLINGNCDNSDPCDPTMLKYPPYTGDCTN